jgi:hypothetical protein
MYMFNIFKPHFYHLVCQTGTTSFSASIAVCKYFYPFFREFSKYRLPVFYI